VPVAACGTPAIVVRKSSARVELWCDRTKRSEFRATFGAHPSGAKEREGDERTPEGDYHVTVRVVDERFHRFLGVSYPNADDLRRAHEKGIRSPGRGIGIHGTRETHAGAARAWIRFASALGLSRVWGPTDGCIALANEDIEVLYDAAPTGTPITILP
jgi:murein L,D-transpeptidase YafK